MKRILCTAASVLWVWICLADTPKLSGQQPPSKTIVGAGQKKKTASSGKKRKTKQGIQGSPVQNTPAQEVVCASVDDEIKGREEIKQPVGTNKKERNTANAAAPSNATTTTEPKTNEENQKKSEAAKLEVVGCITSGKGSVTIPMETTVARGKSITVPIRGLYTWVNYQKGDPSTLRLFLAGQLLVNHKPSLIQVEQGYVKFQLSTISADTEERKAWIQILNEARRQPRNQIPISVGIFDKQPFLTTKFVTFEVEPWYSWLVKLALGVLLILLITFGWRSDLLRDTTAGRPIPPAQAPLSLGRVQMAWWFYLVIASYLFIWIVTKEVNALNATSLTLIGISAGTGLAAIFVDQQKLSADENAKLALQSERSAVAARIAELTHSGSPAAGSPENEELQARKKRAAEIEALLAKYPTVRPIPVGRGLKDLITDGDGISFHRFQIVVWTLVLGLIFWNTVDHDLVMPDFDTTLLGLMGISSGTYIGFKFPEKQKQ